MATKTKEEVFIDSYGNIELYFIPRGDGVYQVKHKEQEYFTDLFFVMNEGYLPDDYYALSVLEWATVGDWFRNYI